MYKNKKRRNDFYFSYEGTGRSLSLKLLQQLRSQATPIGNNANDKTGQNAITGRFLKEVSSISYKVTKILMLLKK